MNFLAKLQRLSYAAFGLRKKAPKPDCKASPECRAEVENMASVAIANASVELYADCTFAFVVTFCDEITEAGVMAKVAEAKCLTNLLGITAR